MRGFHMIDVLDYRLGNFGSVIRMIEKVGVSAKRISTLGRSCVHVVLKSAFL
jgi:hypothetical protein